MLLNQDNALTGNLITGQLAGSNVFTVGNTGVVTGASFARTGGSVNDAQMANGSVKAIGNVNNTTDANKPVSTATQTALNSKQGNITLTTTGTSGASTLTGSTLNIPNYAGGVTSVAGRTGAVVLTKSDVGLANVDNTSDAGKPISSATQTALNGKEPTITKNTAFNKNFGTTAGTVAEGNYSPAKDGTGATGTWGININGNAATSTSFSNFSNSLSGGPFTGAPTSIVGIGSSSDMQRFNRSAIASFLELGSNAFNSTAYLPLTGGNLTGGLTGTSATFSGKLNLSTPTLTNVPLNIPYGVAPTTPVTGDIWRLTTGLRTQTFDGTNTKDYIFDKANSVFAGSGNVGIIANNLGTLSTTPLVSYLTSGNLIKSSAYTITTTDFGANGTVTVFASGNTTITLPTASLMAGISIRVIKTDTAGTTVTLSTGGTITIQNSSVTVVSNGTNRIELL